MVSKPRMQNFWIDFDASGSVWEEGWNPEKQVLFVREVRKYVDIIAGEYSIQFPVKVY